MAGVVSGPRTTAVRRHLGITSRGVRLLFCPDFRVWRRVLGLQGPRDTSQTAVAGGSALLVVSLAAPAGVCRPSRASCPLFVFLHLPRS